MNFLGGRRGRILLSTYPGRTAVVGSPAAAAKALASAAVANWRCAAPSTLASRPATVMTPPIARVMRSDAYVSPGTVTRAGRVRTSLSKPSA